jgi:hypothetical protein
VPQRRQALRVCPRIGIQLGEQAPPLRVGVERVKVLEQARDHLLARVRERNKPLQGRDVGLVLLQELLVHRRGAGEVAERLELEPEEDVDARRLGEARLERADLRLGLAFNDTSAHVGELHLAEVKGRDGELLAHAPF